MRAVSRSMVIASLALLCGGAALAQSGRKVLSNPSPEYPELAKRMHISGVVRVSVVIGMDGQIKEKDFQGGNPVLIDAVQNALNKWRYSPAGSETQLQLEFRF